MFKKLSYQKKIKLLPGLVVIVFLLVYWFAISETIKLGNETQIMETEAAAIERAPVELANLKRKLEEIKKTAGGNTTAEIDPLMELNSKLTTLHHVVLSEYKPAHVFRYQDYTIETRVTTFEAPFIPCLRVLYDLEKSFHNGKFVSVNFSTRTDNKTSKKHLSMQIFVQSIYSEKDKVNTYEE